MRYFFKKNNTGFTLVEMLIYLAIMVVVAVALIQSYIVVFKSNRSSFAENNLRNAGYGAMEAMEDQIRLSQSVDVAHSTLYPSSAGVLQLNQVDASGNGYIVKFATSTTQTLSESAGSTTPALLGPITTNGATVLFLRFSPINTGNSQAVRIELELSATANGVTKNEWFYDTAVLRGSY